MNNLCYGQIEIYNQLSDMLILQQSALKQGKWQHAPRLILSEKAHHQVASLLVSPASSAGSVCYALADGTRFVIDFSIAAGQQVNQLSCQVQGEHRANYQLEVCQFGTEQQSVRLVLCIRAVCDIQSLPNQLLHSTPFDGTSRVASTNLAAVA